MSLVNPVFRETLTVDHAFIRQRTPFEPVQATIEPLELELLARFDAVSLPDFSRQHDLALG